MKNYEESEMKYLEFIQGVITRMASNSFAMKGWMIAIISALLALYADSKPKNECYLLVAAIATLLFWIIDAYYLYIERKYRKLYKDIIYDEKVTLFDMSTKKYESFLSFLKAMFGSVSTIVMYLPIIAGLILAYYLLS
jgi:hypothetical protein